MQTVHQSLVEQIEPFEIELVRQPGSSQWQNIVTYESRGHEVYTVFNVRWPCLHGCARET